MRTRLNSGINGTTGKTDWYRIIKQMIAEELQFFSSPSVKVHSTTRGHRFTVNMPPVSTPGPSGNWNYRGLYQGTATYNTFDVVQYGTGTAAGMYLSTTDGNQNAPTTGTGWVQVSSSSGTWL